MNQNDQHLIYQIERELMKILYYEYSDPTCSYTPIELHAVNLFVGATGSGKTRFFNTIFSLFSAISAGASLATGKWDVRFEADSKIYRYQVQVDGQIFSSEVLSQLLEGEEQTLVERKDGDVFFSGAKLPRLAYATSTLFTLREDPLVSPVHLAASSFVRRNFSGDELLNAAAVSKMSPEVLAKIDREKDLNVHSLLTYPLSVRLKILEKSFKRQYQFVQQAFKQLFPSVTAIEVMTGADFPAYNVQMPQVGGDIIVAAIKEKGIQSFTPLPELSSGMLKVLLILTDLALLKKGSVYMIDEYENSLGVNAIDFLPELLLEYQEKIQFLIISHHPYLINNISMKDWFVFGRHGNAVKIKFGDEITERYSRSKQQAFIKLVNDPFYTEGME